jgi:PhnB protein
MGADHVSFGMVAGVNGFRLAAYDVFGQTGGGLAGFSSMTAHRADGLNHAEPFFIVLNGETFGEVSALWDKLSDGATVIAAVTAAQSDGPSYGMLTDRFGVTWIVGVAPAQA